MGLFKSYEPKVYEGIRGDLNQWVVSYSCGITMDNTAYALNQYCIANDCVPISVSYAYNPNPINGGNLETIAVVKKNGL